MSRVRFRVFYNSIPYDISFREEETISQLRLFILCVTGKLATEPLASLAAKTERLKQTFLDNDAKNGRKYIINLSDMKDLSYSWVGPWDEHKIEEIRAPKPGKLETNVDKVEVMNKVEILENKHLVESKEEEIPAEQPEKSAEPEKVSKPAEAFDTEKATTQLNNTFEPEINSKFEGQRTLNEPTQSPEPISEAIPEPDMSADTIEVEASKPVTVEFVYSWLKNETLLYRNSC